MTNVRFTFDNDFNSNQRPAREQPRSRKSLSAEEVDAIKAEAFREGTQAAAGTLAKSVDHLTGHVVRALTAMDREVETIRAEAATLALYCAKKIASAALASAPEEEIAEALRGALHHAISETHVTIKTAPALVHALDERAAEIAAQEGFEGRLRFIADPSLRGADCRIEWRGGGMERAQQEIENAIANIIQRRFSPGTKE